MTSSLRRGAHAGVLVIGSLCRVFPSLERQNLAANLTEDSQALIMQRIRARGQ